MPTDFVVNSELLNGEVKPSTALRDSNKQIKEFKIDIPTKCIIEASNIT